MGSNSKGDRPRVACEISADRVVAGRAADGRHGLAVYSTRDLAPGSVTPDLTEVNVLRRDDLREGISSSLQSVSSRSRDVIAILPDAAARVALLDFETLPDKRAEAEAVVRFRLKKSLPFDVDKAKVSYQAHTSASGMKVIAAVALSSVVEEYESAFREAGYNPGVVLPSMLAALGAVDGKRPTMVVKVDSFTTAIAILDQSELLLFRSLENTRGLSITGEQLAEDVYPSAVFFQDTYNVGIERILVAGLAESQAALAALRAQTGVEVEELVTPEWIGGHSGGNVPRWRLAGVVGALAS